MDQLKTTKLTVAKICHEIANCLSVMKFLQEDLKDSSVHEVLELCKEIDTLINVTDFFRNIYSTSSNTSNIEMPLMNILKFKGITLCDKSGTVKKLSLKNKKTICGVVYMMMKSCKPGDNIIVEKEDENTVAISMDNQRTIAANIVDTLNAKHVINEDVFNVFAVYVKLLSEEEGFNISANIDKNHILNVKIRRNDNN